MVGWPLVSQYFGLSVHLSFPCVGNPFVAWSVGLGLVCTSVCRSICHFLGSVIPWLLGHLIIWSLSCSVPWSMIVQSLSFSPRLVSWWVFHLVGLSIFQLVDLMTGLSFLWSVSSSLGLLASQPLSLIRPSVGQYIV